MISSLHLQQITANILWMLFFVHQSQIPLVWGKGPVECFFSLSLSSWAPLPDWFNPLTYCSHCQRSSNKFNSTLTRNRMEVSDKNEAFILNWDLENLTALFSTGYHFYYNLCTPQCSIRTEKISHYVIRLLRYLLNISFVPPSGCVAWLIR